MKSDKMQYIIYADFEFLIVKIDGCANNPESSPTIKIEKHIPCGYSVSTVWICDHLEKTNIVYIAGKTVWKHAKNITDFENKIMLQLTKEELKSHQDARLRLWKRMLKKLYKIVSDHCHNPRKYRGAAHNIGI